MGCNMEGKDKNEDKTKIRGKRERTESQIGCRNEGKGGQEERKKWRCQESVAKVDQRRRERPGGYLGRRARETW